MEIGVANNYPDFFMFPFLPDHIKIQANEFFKLLVDVTPRNHILDSSIKSEIDKLATMLEPQFREGLPDSELIIRTLATTAFILYCEHVRTKSTLLEGGNDDNHRQLQRY
jgi:hypothetical protein